MCGGDALTLSLVVCVVVDTFLHEEPLTLCTRALRPPILNVMLVVHMQCRYVFKNIMTRREHWPNVV